MKRTLSLKKTMSQDCIFCKILEGAIPADSLYRDEEVMVFKDLHPQAPTHLLIIPTKHMDTLVEAEPQDQMVLGQLMLTAQRMANQFNLNEEGYRLVLNVGAGAGQAVFHLHLHLLSGRKFEWPPG